MTEPTTAKIQEQHDEYEANKTNGLHQSRAQQTAHKHRGELLKRLEVAEAKLEAIEYRHECLKQMFDDEVKDIKPTQPRIQG